MLIEQGRVSTLGKKDWAAVDLVSEAEIEEICVRIIKWARKHSGAFQLLFPVKERSLRGVELLSPYLFVRSADLNALRGLKVVRGVVGLVEDADGGIQLFEDEFVQEVARKTRKCAEDWSIGIRRGTWVRILLGSERMLVGRVRRLAAGVAEVDISLRLRHVRWTGPVKALLNLGTVKREYFDMED